MRNSGRFHFPTEVPPSCIHAVYHSPPAAVYKRHIYTSSSPPETPKVLERVYPEATISTPIDHLFKIYNSLDLRLLHPLNPRDDLVAEEEVWVLEAGTGIHRHRAPCRAID